MNLDWNTIWKKEASLDDISQERRKEWIYEILAKIVALMRKKFGTEETMDCNLITFQDNMVLVEFPLLAGRTQDYLEVVTEELLQTMFV